MARRPWLIVCAVNLLAALSVASAQAQSEVKPLGRFSDWAAYTYTENGHPVCYAASMPVKSRGASSGRGGVYFLVTHRPEYKDVGIVTMMAGYAYQPDGHAAVKIGGSSFRLFTRDESAWADGDDDDAVVRAMKSGTTMVVTGRTRTGKPTTDLFSLIGFSKAYAAIGAACGVKP